MNMWMAKRKAVLHRSKIILAATIRDWMNNCICIFTYSNTEYHLKISKIIFVFSTSSQHWNGTGLGIFPRGRRVSGRNLVHLSDVIMGAMASQIISLTIVYSTVYSSADRRKHQSSTSLAFVWGIHRWPVNSPHKWPVTRKMFPFDDVIMYHRIFRFRQKNVWLS